MTGLHCPPQCRYQSIALSQHILLSSAGQSKIYRGLHRYIPSHGHALGDHGLAEAGGVSRKGDVWQRDTCCHHPCHTHTNSPREPTFPSGRTEWHVGAGHIEPVSIPYPLFSVHTVLKQAGAFTSWHLPFHSGSSSHSSGEGDLCANPSVCSQNTSMERMSSYSNNGTGSGSNSDTEAHNTCTHSSSRAEPATQVSPHWHRASQDISS